MSVRKWTARSAWRLLAREERCLTPNGIFRFCWRGNVPAIVVCSSGTAGLGESRIVHSLQGIFEQAAGPVSISGLKLTAITRQAAGVVFGEEVDHLFADDTAQVPRIAGIAGIHESA